MNASDGALRTNATAMPNGSGAAAILSAGAGSFALAVLAFAADKSALFKSSLIFYRPTGPLSGVTMVAILIWLLCWCILEWRWQRRNVAIGSVSIIALALLGLSLLLTFPPFVDLF
jgi:hypothetical protein